ncbi:MAG TPA: hypothetical protein VFQ60_02110 [Patescibacteria group bacterium]|nr:hypothetical protein [Patescibacteria group bacterium]
MGFEPIRRILPKAIATAGITKQVTAARVIEEANRITRALWGEEKTRYLEIVSFANGILKWRVRSASALQELKSWETRFINELNRELGSRTIRAFSYTDH